MEDLDAEFRRGRSRKSTAWRAAVARLPTLPDQIGVLVRAHGIMRTNQNATSKVASGVMEPKR